MKDIKLIELFSGIGAQAKAFERVDCFNVDVVGTCDLDKEVVVDYAAIHCGLTNEVIEDYDFYPSKEEMVKDLTDKRLGYDFVKDKPYDWAKLSKKKDKTNGIEKYWLADQLSKNFGDITQVKSLPNTDILFYSFPCTDISLAGKQDGVDWTCNSCGNKYNPIQYDVEHRYKCPVCGSENIKSTRSGLLYEVERLLVDYKKREDLPNYLILENVAALVNSKFIGDFNNWLERLDALGYNNYWKVMNTKETGIPQNRPRLFCVSIKKDIDKGNFKFPEPFDSGLRLKDLLENDQEIIDKYFLSDEVQARLVITNPEFSDNIIGTTKPEFRTIGQRDVVYKEDCIMGTLMATDYKQPKQIYVGDIGNNPVQSGTLMGKYEKMMDISRRVYDENGIAPTLHCASGGNTEPKVSRNNLKVVRKLTPKECFRLQNFDDEDYEKCKAVGMCDTQGYKATGNSITVRCIELLCQHLYKAQYDENYICLDEYMQTQKCTEMPKLVGGFGEMKSNGGKQFYQQDRVYDGDGIAMAHPAQIPGGSYKYLVNANDTDNKIITVGQVSSEGSQGGKVYGIDGVSQTVMACTHGYGMGNIYDDRNVYCAASRGRYNEDGSIDQHLEIRSSEFTNALTTVTKDNLIVEVAE